MSRELGATQRVAAWLLLLGALVPWNSRAGPLELARGRTATQSSTYGSLSASLAVDGNTNGALGAGSTTHTQADAFAWWQVDLGAARTLSRVDVWNRTDACGDRLQNFYVFISPVPFTSNDPEVTRAQPGVTSFLITGQAGSPTSATFNATQGRFVRVQLRGTNYLSLAEVQVWGSPWHLDIDGDRRSDITAWSPNAAGPWGDSSYEMLPQGQVTDYGFDAYNSHTLLPLDFRTGGAAQYEVLPVDVNGDGKMDLAALSGDAAGVWASAIDVSFADGMGFWTQPLTTHTPMHMRNGGSARYVTLAGDFNGDGRGDLATLSPNGTGGWSSWMSMELSTGWSLGSVVWPSATPGNMRGGGKAIYKTLAGDFNGDGRTDLVTLSPNGSGLWRDKVSVDLSTGAGFTTAWWVTDLPEHLTNGGATSTYETFVGDFNRDGRSDLATLSRDGQGAWASNILVDLSTGSGFTSYWWAAHTPFHMRNAGSSALYTVLAGDFDGDGRTDLATLSPNAQGGWGNWLAVELSTGTSFTSGMWPSLTPVHMRNGGASSRYLTVTGDFNGDGRTDLATLSPDAEGAWANSASVDLSSGSGSFTSFLTPSAIPGAMRQGGRTSDYLLLSDTPGRSGVRFDDVCDAYAVRRESAPLVHKWNLLGHQLHWLGCPVSDVFPSRDGGGYQLFTGGRLYTSIAGTFAVREPMLSQWLATCAPGGTACGVDGRLGYPLDDDAVTPEGVTTQLFSGGALQVSAAGAFILPTDIYQAWLRTGGLAGLGRATGAVVAEGSGFEQPFAGGMFYASQHGAYAVRGPILARWNASGGATGSLGFPIGDEQTYADGGRTQVFWDGGKRSVIASHPSHGTWLVVGGEWLRRGGPTQDNGAGIPFGWPRGEARRYSDHPEMSPTCSTHASRMYQQDFVAGTTCYFQDAAPQLEFLPHPPNKDARDCHKSVLNPYRNPDSPCFTTYIPPATFPPPQPEWGCATGYTCTQGPTYASDEPLGQRHCGCASDLSLSGTHPRLVLSVYGWSGSNKACDGHPGGKADCIITVQDILDHLRNYGGVMAKRFADKFDQDPSDVEFKNIDSGAAAEAHPGILGQGQKIVLHLNNAWTMRYGNKRGRDIFASFFAHEVQHLRFATGESGSIYGEAEAYLAQYEVMREFGYDHCAQAVLLGECVTWVPFSAWNYHYVWKKNAQTQGLFGMPGLADLRVVLKSKYPLYPYDAVWGLLHPPARYWDQNSPPQGFTGPNCMPACQY
ncbi:FG-GAP-like repeat-containing protein [Myxococcaceae bacterium GXIMD 01537]